MHTSISTNFVGAPPKKLSTWYKKYRIMQDTYSGYEVQCWRIWWPIWLQADYSNTFRTIEGATRFAEIHAGKVVEKL